MSKCSFRQPLAASVWAVFVTAAGWLLLLGGCGGDGIERHPVGGKVTFRGQPVDYGTIVFEPEESAGPIAPTSFARIEKGSYQTVKAESPTKGAYKVRVMGFDASKMKKDTAPGEIIDTPELFPAYTMSVEIPPQDERLDIEVPDRPVTHGK